MDDAQALREFVGGSERAFAHLVRRHIDLVYSAALRQVRDPQAAEDVTQLTFIALAKKAAGLRGETALAAWLLVTTRYYALNALRAGARRRRHEGVAAAMAQTADLARPSDPWDEIAPHLDAAMASLSGNDRRAITLRYFEGRDLRQVAEAMGVSLDAAKQRVHRATLRLRAFFAARGLDVPVAAIGPAIVAHAVHLAAPAHLVQATVLAGVAAQSAAATTFIAKGAAVLMASAKTKIVVGAAALALIGGGSVATWRALRPPREQTVVLPGGPAAPTVQTAGGADWRQAFDAAYGLAPGQDARYVPPPFIPQRQLFWDAEQQRGAAPRWKLGETRITFVLDDKGLHWTSFGGGSGNVFEAVRFCAGLKEYEIDPSVQGIQGLDGDWVVRQSVGLEQRLAAIAGIVGQKLGRPVHFVRRTVRQEAIVVRGTYAETDKVEGHVLSIDDGSGRGPQQVPTQEGPPQRLLELVADLMGKRVFNEASFPDNLLIKYQMRLDLPRRENIKAILARLAEQTSLTFDLEPRDMPVWAIEDGPAPTTLPVAGATP